MKLARFKTEMRTIALAAQDEQGQTGVEELYLDFLTVLDEQKPEEAIFVVIPPPRHAPTENIRHASYKRKEVEMYVFSPNEDDADNRELNEQGRLDQWDVLEQYGDSIMLALRSDRGQKFKVIEQKPTEHDYGKLGAGGMIWVKYRFQLDTIKCPAD